MQRAAPVTPDRLTILAFVTIVVVLGMNFVSVRYSVRELDPFWGAGVRFLIASAVLLGIAKARGVSMPRGRALLGAALYGLFAISGVYSMLYWALQYVSSAMSSVLMATMPLFTLIVATAIGQERFRFRALLATMGAIVGLGIAFAERIDADVRIVAMLMVLAGALFGAISGIVVKGFPRSHPFATNVVAMFVGALILFAASVLTGETPSTPTLVSTWLAVGYLVFSSCVGFVLMVWLLGRWTASAASYALVLMPLIATASGALLLGESVGVLFGGGALIVLLSVYLGAVRQPKTEAQPTAKRVAFQPPPC